MDTTYAFNDQVEKSLLPFLGSIPKRWGRMDPLSRVLLVEVGRILLEKSIIETGQKCTDRGLCVGLIGATRRGCLYIDYAFKDSMEEGLPSPALFGYTLPNSPLGEAAGQFGLTGPVYALFAEENPLNRAEEEARKLLFFQPELSFMLACEFEHRETMQGVELLANLTIVEK